MDGRIMKWGLMFLLCIPFWTACRNDDVPEATAEPQKDCEVSVSIRLNAKSLRAMGDPGQGVDEFDSQYWTRIDIFLVYNWGQVLQYTLDKNYQPGDTRTFNAFAGTVKAVYAVAYNNELLAHAYAPYSEQQIQDLRTSEIEGLEAEQEKQYLLSLFSGTATLTDKGNPIEVVKEESTEIKVGLNRLVAKVDVQWDAQDAYQSGRYVEAKMGGITFNGESQGYFFPEGKTTAESDALSHVAAYKMDNPISERNGRTYFYTFSGAKNTFVFTVKHKENTSATETFTNYTATFANALERSSWHKVDLTVSGSTFTETTGDLVLTPKSAIND